MNDLRDRLMPAFDQEPPHRAVEEQLRAAHRAARRRRTAVGAAAAVAVVLGAAAVAPLLTDRSSTDAPGVATEPGKSAPGKQSDPKLPDPLSDEPERGPMPTTEDDFLQQCRDTVWQTPAANAELFDDDVRVVASDISRDQALAVLVSGDDSHVGVCRFDQVQVDPSDGSFLHYESHVAVYELGDYGSEPTLHNFGGAHTYGGHRLGTHHSWYANLPAEVATVEVEFYDGHVERLESRDGWFALVYDEQGDRVEDMFKRMSYYDADGTLLAYQDSTERAPDGEAPDRPEGVGFLEDYPSPIGGTELVSRDYESGMDDYPTVG